MTGEPLTKNERERIAAAFAALPTDAQVAIKRAALFEQWAMMCFENEEFMANYRRLYSSTFCLGRRQPRNGLEAMIDEATGYDKAPHLDDKEAHAFLDFCRDMLDRLPIGDGT